MVGFQIKSALSSCPPALKMVSVPVSITLLAKSLKSVSVTCVQHAKFIYLNMRSYPGRWPGLCSNCLGCPISCRAAEGNLLHLAQVSQQLLDAMLELWKPGQRLWGFQFPSVVQPALQYCRWKRERRSSEGLELGLEKPHHKAISTQAASVLAAHKALLQGTKLLFRLASDLSP